MQTLISWQSPEHHFDKKSVDWYWSLGVIAAASAILAFYFGNFLFGIFIVIAALLIGLLSYHETRSVEIKITDKGILFGRQFYPFRSYRSFWLEDDHIHGAKILLHPVSSFLPLASIHVNIEQVDLNDVYAIMSEFLDEEYLEESILHKWFDKLLAR